MTKTTHFPKQREQSILESFLQWPWRYFNPKICSSLGQSPDLSPCSTPGPSLGPSSGPSLSPSHGPSQVYKPCVSCTISYDSLP